MKLQIALSAKISMAKNIMRRLWLQYKPINLVSFMIQ